MRLENHTSPWVSQRSPELTRNILFFTTPFFFSEKTNRSRSVRNHCKWLFYWYETTKVPGLLYKSHFTFYTDVKCFIWGKNPENATRHGETSHKSLKLWCLTWSEGKNSSLRRPETKSPGNVEIWSRYLKIYDFGIFWQFFKVWKFDFSNFQLPY